MFEIWGEQYSELTNSLVYDIIVHQSRNIVNSFSGKKEEKSIDHEPTFAEQVDMVLAGNANRYNDLKVCDTPDFYYRLAVNSYLSYSPPLKMNMMFVNLRKSRR